MASDMDLEQFRYYATEGNLEEIMKLYEEKDIDINSVDQVNSY